MKTRINTYHCIIALMATLCCENGFGQVSSSLFFMDHLPAASSLNPSFTPANNFFIDLPLVSSTFISAELPFAYSELTEKNQAEDKIYINKGGVISSMDKVGTVSFDLNTQLARTGFRIGRHFINFNVAKVFTADVSLERDLVEFLLFGNGSDAFLGKTLNLSKTGFKASMYHEFAAGWATKFSDKFSAGVRFKYLNGVLNAWSEKAGFTLYTDPLNNYALTASTDLLVHTSATQGYLEDLDFANPMDYILVDFSGNHGFAGDIGIAYRPLERMQVSASAVDLGMITWKENVKSYRSKYPDKTYTFDGFEIDQLLNGGALSDSIAILDSLGEHFSIESISGPYTSMLTPKAFLGVTYNLTRNDQFGLLLKGKFPENNFLASYTLNYRRTFGDVLAVFANYTIQKNANHIGFGLSLRAGPVMFYALNDRFDSLFEPANARGYNVQFGISLVFGKPGREKEPGANPVPVAVPAEEPPQTQDVQ